MSVPEVVPVSDVVVLDAEVIIEDGTTVIVVSDGEPKEHDMSNP